MGRLFFKSSIYEGQFKNGERDGWGRMIYTNGSYYQGNWSNGMLEGEGKLGSCILNMRDVNAYNNDQVDVSEFNMEESYNIQEGTFQMGSL